MKNKYEIKDDIVIIHLNRGLQTKISIEDFDKVNSHPGTWGAYPGGRGYFYVHSKIPGTRKHMKLARFILGVEDPDVIVDHIDLDTLNNTRENLRATDRKINRYNSRISRNNTSGVTGVKLVESGKWQAYIYIDNKCKNLGVYVNKEDAIDARKREEERLGR